MTLETAVENLDTDELYERLIAQLIKSGRTQQFVERRMIEAQARVISKLHAEISDLRNQNSKLAQVAQRDAPAAKFYFALQDAIMKSQTLQSEWENFILIAKLAVDEPVAGITH